jgi:primosomal protein N' (replication factor Y)
MRIARMDWDAVRNKEAHHKLISLFEQRRIDILAGTQMVVKGLDFDHVHLVGILSADSLLSYPDFRLHERAFQLLEQVSGRSGRREKSGKVVLQAINTTHPLLNFVIRHDYEGFYQTELEERKRFDYPPFSRLIRVELKHRKQEVVHEAASTLNQALQPYFHGILLGPAVPTIGRVRNYYLVEFLIKLPRNSGIIDKAKKVLREKFSWLQSQKNFRSVVIIPDVDCV